MKEKKFVPLQFDVTAMQNESLISVTTSKTKIKQSMQTNCNIYSENPLSHGNIHYQKNACFTRVVGVIFHTKSVQGE